MAYFQYDVFVFEYVIVLINVPFCDNINIVFLFEILVPIAARQLHSVANMIPKDTHNMSL